MPNFEHFNRQKTAFRHFERNQFERGAYRYGFGGAIFDFNVNGVDNKTDLGLISSWRDDISGLVFSQSNDANKPRFLDSDTNFNNLPSVDFNTVAKRLNNNLGVPISKNNTYLIAYRKQSDPAGAGNRMGAIFSDGVNLPNTKGIFAYLSSASIGGAQQWVGVGGIGGRMIISIAADLNPHILVISGDYMVQDGVDVSDAGGWPSTLNPFSGVNMNSHEVTGSMVWQTPQIIIYNGNYSINEMIRLSYNMNEKFQIPTFP